MEVNPGETETESYQATCMKQISCKHSNKKETKSDGWMHEGYIRIQITEISNSVIGMIKRHERLDIKA